jgi:pimeloyl-ACP methyl ester carboxylesterase
MAQLMRPPAPDRETALDNAVNAGRIMFGGGFEFDEDRARHVAGLAYDRCFYPAGQARQTAAIMAHGSRVDALAKLEMPTLVIHGDDDPLVPVEGGRDTARAVPGSTLLEIPGMGHALPRAAWGQISEAICAHADKAGR